MMHQKTPIRTMDRKVPSSLKVTTTSTSRPVTSQRPITGLTVNKVKFATNQVCAKRRNEIFYRLQHNQMFDLYCEYESGENERITESRGQEMGSPPKIVTHSQYSEALNSKPYLILDVREPEAFSSCHLKHARNYPFTMMRRDQVLPEINRFKNKEEMLIIIYCDDERISRDAAKLFVDRGTDNIFLLTGGLFEFASEYSTYAEYSSFIEGDVSQSYLSKVGSTFTPRGLTRIPEDSRTTNTNTANSSYLNSSKLNTLGVGPNFRNDTQRMRRPYSEAGYSVNSNVSMAESVISRSMARKGKF